MEILTIWIGTFTTLMVFSFLYKENPFFRFVEHVFVGVSAGYYFSSISVHQVLKPNLFWKLFPSFAGSDAPPDYILLIPAVLGIFMLLRLTERFAWLSRISIAVVMGVTAGMTIVAATQELLLPQIRKTMVSLWIPGNLFVSFSNWVLFTGTVSCLFYFFFGSEQKGIISSWVSKVGRGFLMICFGAIFGAAVMGRVAFLIGRCQFLVNEFLPTLSGRIQWFLLPCAFLAGIAYIATRSMSGKNGC